MFFRTGMRVFYGGGNALALTETGPLCFRRTESGNMVIESGKATGRRKNFKYEVMHDPARCL